MRFENLSIPAFGPFTDFRLSFRAAPSDLHVIYGRNEAGKSSLLRAIHDLLFGIHGQSSDNFLHDYKRLRIAAEIGNRSGQTLSFQRRKGSKNTLLDPDDRELPESALTPFLGAVDERYFSAMFGLGPGQLREGAAELLRGEGEIGRALFSASLGGTPVQQTIAALEVEANQLFKPNRAGANLRIRKRVDEYKECLKKKREAEANPEDWHRLVSDLDAAERTKTELSKVVTDAADALDWLRRYEDALPSCQQYFVALGELESLQFLPEVASDFLTRARMARDELTTARGKIEELRQNIASSERRLHEFPDHSEVLGREAALETLHRRLGAYTEQTANADSLRQKLAGFDAKIGRLLRDLHLEGEVSGAARFHIADPKRIACEEAARALLRLRQEKAANDKNIAGLESEIEDQKPTPDSQREQEPTEARAALQVAAEATASDKALDAKTAEAGKLKMEVARLHRRVPGAPPDHEAAAELTAPAPATVRKYREGFAELERIIAREADIVSRNETSIQNLKGDLERLQIRGVLPTEEELRVARRHRDAGWQTVKTAWKGRGEEGEWEVGVPLEEAFPKAIARADELVDVLRHNSDAAAQAAEKRLQLEEAGLEIVSARKRQGEAEGKLAGLEAEWRAEWAAANVVPKSPAEMEEWLENWERFQNALARYREAGDSLGRDRGLVRQAKERLAAVLGQSADEEFPVLYEEVRKRVEKAEKAAGAREEAVKTLKRSQSRLEKLVAAAKQLSTCIDAAAETWRTECASIRLPDGTSPEAGLILMERRHDLQARADDWQEAKQKLETLGESIKSFESEVRKQAVGLGISTESVESAEAELWKRLAFARTGQAARQELSNGLANAKESLQTSKANCDRAVEELNKVLQSAGVESENEIESRLAQLERRFRIQADLKNIRGTLSGLARAEPVERFVELVRAENPASVTERKSAAEEAKRENGEKLQALNERIYGLKARLSELETAGDAAAAHQQDAEFHLAGIRDDASRYLRLRFAISLLRDQVEKFRKENQGPLLARSGAIFSAVTCGGFAGLGTEFNDKDEPVLVGVRPGQPQVGVQGMSDGTRDQLFLSLRLAALEQHLRTHEPMPLILDDLLITFDDARARAILPRLLELARQTQVLLFTHHSHLLGLCRETLGEGNYHTHRLGEPQAGPRGGASAEAPKAGI